MIHYSDPPILLRDVIEDIGDVVQFLERNASYTPLGGWYRAGLSLKIVKNAMAHLGPRAVGLIEGLRGAGLKE